MLILREADTQPVHTLAFSPDGLTLASISGRSYAVSLWDIQTRAVRHTLSGHRRRVAAVAFAPSGKAIATAGSTGEVRIWEVNEAPSLESPFHWVIGHQLTFVRQAA